MASLSPPPLAVGCDVLTQFMLEMNSATAIIWPTIQRVNITLKGTVLPIFMLENN
jgi:hypothetical protein